MLPTPNNRLATRVASLPIGDAASWAGAGTSLGCLFQRLPHYGPRWHRLMWHLLALAAVGSMPAVAAGSTQAIGEGAFTADDGRIAVFRVDTTDKSPTRVGAEPGRAVKARFPDLATLGRLPFRHCGAAARAGAPARGAAAP